VRSLIQCLSQSACDDRVVVDYDLLDKSEGVKWRCTTHATIDTISLSIYTCIHILTRGDNGFI